MENFDALKRYESTEVNRRTWIHVPAGNKCNSINNVSIEQVVLYSSHS